MGGTHRGLPEPPGHHPQPRLVPGARGNYNSQGTRMQFGRCWEAQAGLGVSRLGCRDPHTPGALSPRGWRSRSGSAGLAAAPAASAGAAPRCAAAAPAAPRPETRLQGRRGGTPSLRHPEAGPPTPAIAPAQGSCLLALHALQPGGNLLARRPWPTRRRPGHRPTPPASPGSGTLGGGRRPYPAPAPAAPPARPCRRRHRHHRCPVSARRRRRRKRPRPGSPRPLRAQRGAPAPAWLAGPGVLGPVHGRRSVPPGLGGDRGVRAPPKWGPHGSLGETNAPWWKGLAPGGGDQRLATVGGPPGVERCWGSPRAPEPQSQNHQGLSRK